MKQLSRKYLQPLIIFCAFIMITWAMALSPLPVKISAAVPQFHKAIFQYIDLSDQSYSQLTIQQRDLGAVSERLIKINLQPLFSVENTELELDLFESGNYKAVRQNLDVRATDDISWQGKIFNQDGDGFDVILTTRNGLMSGLIYTPDQQIFRVRPLQNGLHKVVKIEQSKLPGCGADNTFDLSNSQMAEQQIDQGLPISPLPLTPIRTRSTVQLDESPTSEDDFARIDMLVLFTPDAIQRAGGFNVAEVEAQHAIDVTNTAYTNSRIRTQLRLAKVAELPIQEEAEFSSMLRTLRTNEMAHSLREAARADLVSLIVTKASLCGIAYINAKEDFGYSVVNIDCAASNLTFAHEVGHNQGCSHNPENSNGGAFQFSFGHYQEGFFSTIMTTFTPNNPCGRCDRIPYFSNPNIKFRGADLGVEDQRDNSLTINIRAVTIANFRQNSTDRGVNVSLSPTTQIVAPGQSATYNANFNRNSFTGSISSSLICNSGDCPATIKIDQTDFVITNNATSLTFTTNSNGVTPPGSYQYLLRSTADGITIADSNIITLMVTTENNVKISVSPASQFVTPGESATYKVDLNRNNFTEPVNLKLFCSNMDCPSGIKVDKTEFTLSENSTTITFTTNIGALTPPGNYQFFLSGSATGIAIADSLPFTLEVVPKTPMITSIDYRNPLLTINGSNLGTSGTKVFLNDRNVNLSLISQSNSSVLIKGNKKKLGLKANANANMVYIIDKFGQRSNTFSFTLNTK